MARDLTRAELKAWRRFIGGTFSLFQTLDRQLREESGLSHHEFSILSALSNSRASRMRMRELAEGLGSSPSRLSHSIKRLEEAGWVDRIESDEDGRGRIACLTDAGRRKLADAWPGHAAVIRKVVLEQLEREELPVFEDVFARIQRASRRET